MQERSPDCCFQVSNLNAEAYKSQSCEQLIDELVRLRQRIAELESHFTAQTKMVTPITNSFLPTDCKTAGTAEALTNHRPSQAALNELAAFNPQLITSIQEGVIVCDLDFRYWMWNQAMEQMSGLQADAVLGKRPLDVFPFFKNTDIDRLLFRVLTGETVTVPDTYFQIPETGKSGWMSAKFSPLYTTNGNIIGVVGIVHDITPRKQAEQTLEYRIRFERLVAQLSAELINLKLNEIDTHLQQGLRSIATFANVDWAWIYLYSDNEMVAIKAYEWVAPNVTSPLDQTTVSMAAFAWSIERMRQSQPLFVPDIINLPVEAKAERNFADAIGTKSLLVIPMMYQGNLIGALELRTFYQPMNWSLEDIDLFMMLGTIFAGAILRKQGEFTSQAVLQAIPDLLIRFDRNGIYLDMVNPGQVQLLKQKHECIGKNICDILPPDLAKQRLRYIQQAFETGEMQIYEYEIEIKGEILYEESRIFVSDENEALCMIRDITDRKRAEQERNHAEQALRQQVKQARLITEITQNIHQSLDLNQILDTTVTGIRQLLKTDRVLFYSFESDCTGLVMAESVANGWCSLLGQALFSACSSIEICFTSPDQPYAQIKESVIADIYCAEPATPCTKLLSQLQVKSNLIAPVWQGEFLRGLLMAQQCAAPRQWQQTDIDLLKQLANQVAIAIHQSELYQRLQSANQELQRLAALDGLTQVANRRRFDEYLDWQWQQLQRDRTSVALILCDVDFFKPYNDHYGHQAGDDCLKQIAQAIEQTIKRPSDLVARYGGEEFVVVLPNTNPEGAMHVALDIQARIVQLQISHACSPISDYITLSMGIAWSIPTPDITPQDLIAKADQALYEAKSQGRNTCCVSNV